MPGARSATRGEAITVQWGAGPAWGPLAAAGPRSEAARKERSRRIGAAGIEQADLATVTREDVVAAPRGERSQEELDRALAELDGMEGLRQVKEEVRGLVALMREQRDRQHDGRVASFSPPRRIPFLRGPGPT